MRQTLLFAAMLMAATPATADSLRDEVYATMKGAIPILCALTNRELINCDEHAPVTGATIRDGVLHVEVAGYPNANTSGEWGIITDAMNAFITKRGIKSWTFTMGGYELDAGDGGSRCNMEPVDLAKWARGRAWLCFVFTGRPFNAKDGDEFSAFGWQAIKAD